MSDIPRPAVGEIVTIHRLGGPDRRLEITEPGDWALTGMDLHEPGWTMLHGHVLDDDGGPAMRSLYVQWTGPGGWQMKPALSVPMEPER